MTILTCLIVFALSSLTFSWFEETDGQPSGMAFQLLRYSLGIAAICGLFISPLYLAMTLADLT